MSTRILAIDPGLDAAGVAVFDVDRYDAGHERGDFERALQAVTRRCRITTDTADTMPVRLHQLAQDVNQIVLDEGPVLIYVEEPVFAGTYNGGEKRRNDVSKLYKAIGAIASAAQRSLPSGRVLEVRAGTERKAERLQLLEAAAKRAGVLLPCGPRGGRMEDVWDALYLGCFVLSTRIVSDLRRIEVSV